MTAARRTLGGALLIGTILAVLFFAVLPSRDFLDQRERSGALEAQLAAVHDHNAELEARIASLSTPEEVERIARRDFSLVYPGEEAYAVLPPPPRPVSLPPAWPFSELADLIE